MRNSEQIFDELLVLNAQSGDKAAFGLLVKRWHDRVCRQINWMVHDKDLAQDLGQECWISIGKSITKLDDPNKFGSWLLRIAHNKTVDYLRKNKRHQEILNEISLDNRDRETAIDVDKEALYAKLQTALSVLDQGHKQVLKMHYLNGISVLQISEILAIPMGTVKSRLFKARQQMRNIINQNKE